MREASATPRRAACSLGARKELWQGLLRKVLLLMHLRSIEEMIRDYLRAGGEIVENPIEAWLV